MTKIDPRALRHAFGRFMTGVTVVTTRTPDGVPLGFTANSFTSVSLDPPLLLVCPGKYLSSYSDFANCSHFAVSILAEGQETVSNTFAGFKGDRFANVAHSTDSHGVPVIDGAVVSFSCKTHNVVDAGDHVLLIGEVVDFNDQNRPGLGYQAGQYFSLGLERSARDPAVRKNVCGAIIQVLDTVLLEKTSAGYSPPQLDLPDRRSLVQSLFEYLAASGVDAEIGTVYSVFDDPTKDTHYSYLLASAVIRQSSPAEGTALEAVPVSRLAGLNYTSPAIGQMMRRYAVEATTGDFTLYLGDAEQGETHAYSDKG
ncbi:MAG: flavin reductase family protein [Ruegeria sp.]